MPIHRLPVSDNGTISMREHQQRMTEVGRIRLGFFDPEGKGRPVKLDRFRFTSTDGDLIRAVAEQYGGTPGQYTPQRSNAVQWEVVSQVSEVPVYVPQQRIDPWMEAWRPGMAIRRCDGITETISGEDCHCALRKVAPKDRCKPTVRVQLMLAEVPGLGTWRLESHGAYAAGELATLAPLIAVVPMPIPAKLLLREEARSWMENGQRKNTTFYVPWLHISAATPSQFMLGGDALSHALSASTQAAAIEAAPTQPAIEAAPPSTPPATPPSTPPGTPPAEPVRLGEQERAVILGKIEEARTVERLHEIAGKLRARGVKDERVKQSLQSKAASIEAAHEIGGSATGPADTSSARTDHQQGLKDAQARFQDRVQAAAGGREVFPDVLPQYDEAIARGATHAEIVDAGGPLHWLASDDQARDYAAYEQSGAPDDVDPDATFGNPPDAYPVEDAQEVDYDTDEEFALIYPAAGPFGWTTSQTNDWIKKFCGVEKVSQATGNQLHALRMAMKDNPEMFR